jgi:hypothetical protein
MFFPAGGGTLKGYAKLGDIVWSRIFLEGGGLHMDLGRGRAVALSPEEQERRARATNYEWPIMNAVLTGISRDHMTARHKANHIQLVYAHSAAEADRAMAAKAALAQALGMTVSLCGI